MITGHLAENPTIPYTTGRIYDWQTHSVRLSWEKPGHLTLIHSTGDTVGGIIQVPVTIEGRPPAISFKAKALADAFDIAPPVDDLNSRNG